MLSVSPFTPTNEQGENKGSRNVIICCDGTNNEFGRQNVTNVIKFFNLLDDIDPKSQISYYSPGVGTMGGSKWIKSAFGWGVEEDIRDMYKYLMDRYSNGDKIFLLGFSRGAYAVRGLAGLINKCGLLQKGNDNLIRYALDMYWNKNNLTEADMFKDAFSRSIETYFVGVWDTVSSYFPYPRSHVFGDNILRHSVRFGYQALAIDERRADFNAEVWRNEMINLPDVNKKRKHENIYDPNSDQEEFPMIEQVWFAGVHSNIGGFYDEDGLSNVSLKWMINKGLLHNLIFRKNTKEDFTSNLTNPPNKIISTDEIPEFTEGDYRDKIIDSSVGLWNLRPKRRRKIPENSRIHETVLKRMRYADVSYHPKNLPKNYVVVNDNGKIVGTESSHMPKYP